MQTINYFFKVANGRFIIDAIIAGVFNNNNKYKIIIKKQFLYFMD